MQNHWKILPKFILKPNKETEHLYKYQIFKEQNEKGDKIKNKYKIKMRQKKNKNGHGLQHIIHSPVSIQKILLHWKLGERKYKTKQQNQISTVFYGTALLFQ